MTYRFPSATKLITFNSEMRRDNSWIRDVLLKTIKCQLKIRDGIYSYVCENVGPPVNPVKKKVSTKVAVTNTIQREPASTNVINLKKTDKKKRRRHRLKLRCRMIEGKWYNMTNTTQLVMQLPSLLSISCPRAMVLHSTKVATNENLMRLDYKCCSVHNIPSNMTKPTKT